MNSSLKTLVLFVSLLCISSFSQANPGGVGPSTQDMQCGGACHGDADLNATSPFTIQIQQTSTAYAGLPMSLNVEVSNLDQMQIDVLGVFLLTDTTGFEDTPEDDGWAIVSNSQGGDENYVEAQPTSPSVDIGWVLKPPSEPGTFTFFASIHHGSTDQSGTPYFGISNEPLTIEVLPVPENLPRIDPGIVLPSQRNNGEQTTFTLSTLEVDTVLVEWRLQDGETHVFNATNLGEQQWEVTIPATLTPGIVEWRVTLEGNDIVQTSPWLQISSLSDSTDIDNSMLYLQSFALLVFSCGFYLGLTILLPSKPVNQDKQFAPLDETDEYDGGEDA